MQKRFDNVLNKQGNALQGIRVTVKDYPAGTLASIYASNGSDLIGGSYVTTDALGYYEYYAADGRYIEEISGPGIETEIIQDILIEDAVSDLASSSGSSLVGFIQSGTGATARKVEDKGRDIVSPEDFGAVGDGTTDDDAALDKAEAAHTAVFLPNRSYEQTDTSLAAEFYGPGHVLLPKFTHSPMVRGLAKALTPPDAFTTAWGSTPPVLPKYTAHGWRGDVSVRNFMPSLGSVAYYVDGLHGNDSALGIALTITGITRAATAVVSYTGSDPTNGHQVYINGVSGMTEVNGRYFTIANVNAGSNTFELSGINSSAYTTYSADGTAYFPLQGIDAAIAKNDATVIYVAPFTYQRADDWGSSSPATSNDSLVVLPWNIRTGKIISGPFFNHTAASWNNDETYESTWYATVNAAAVRDYRYITADGEHLPYELAQSNSDCNNRRGTYYTDGTTTWVHTLDDDCPNDFLAVFFAESGPFYSSDKVIYVEGIEFHGGNAAFRPRNNSTATTSRLYMKDCKFLYANGASNGNGLEAEGIALIVLENCEAAFNLFDGFNYHVRNSVVCKVIEINCKGHHNGRNRAGTNNGSSMHDAGSIIRIGGEYWQNEGPNVPDVGGSFTWNVGTFAHDSARYEVGITKADFYNSAGSMWLYDCTADGSENSVTTTSSGNTYLDRFKYNDALTESSATIQGYVQL